MITPSRWFSGGKGLDEFRQEMLNDKHFVKIIDYVDNSMLFSNVLIVGGVNYFLWSEGYQGKCEFVSVRKDRTSRLERDLSEYDMIIKAGIINPAPNP